MPASLKDVAKLANVSLTTASFALNGKPVKEETRQKVLEAAEKLHYYVNVNGRNLSTKKTHNIALVVLNENQAQDYTEQLSYYYHLVKGVMDYAQEKQYSVKYEVVPWDSLNKNDYFEKIVYGHSVDGIIVVPQYKYSCDFIRLFEEEDFPYVVINPWFEVEHEHRIMVDNYTGGLLVADYLERKKFEKIYMIGGPKDHISASYIEKGFLAGLLRAGIRFDVSNIVYSDYTYEGGMAAMKQLMEEHDMTDSVVFCANDYMATGAMSVLKEMGIKIPDQVSFIGFDGMEVSKCVYPPLTTMQVDTKYLGECAARRLLGIIDHDPNRKFFREVVLMPRMIEGKTVRNRK